MIIRYMIIAMLAAYTLRIVYFLAFGAIIVLGGWLRVHGLGTTPPGLSIDEAFNATSALVSLQNNDYSLFYFQGQWALTGPFFWIISGAMSLFGDELWVIRLVPALIGTLTLLLMFGLCMEYWRSHPKRIALSLLACALLAISSWHMHTTRLIFNGTLAPLCEVMALWILLVAMRQQKSHYFFAAGIVMALGIYSYWQYIPFMLLPFLIIICSALPSDTKKNAVLIFTLGVIVSAAPFIIASLQQDIFFRVTQLKITNEIGADQSFINQLLQLVDKLRNNIARTLMMLFVVGDGNWRHNYDSQPALGFLTQCGLFLSVVYARNNTSAKFKLANSMLWGWFIISMLPAVLTSEGVPHGWRSNCMVLPICMLAAYGIVNLIEEYSPPYRNMVIGGIVLAIMYSSYVSYDRFYNGWGTDGRTKRAFDMSYVNNRHGDDGPVYRDLRYVKQALWLNAR